MSGFRIMEPEELDSVIEEMKANADAADLSAREAGKQFLDEKQDKELIDSWWKEAVACRTVDESTAFAKRLSNDYRHDYGTICHATAAAGVAMAYAVGHGVTGFQAGAIGWMLHSKWQQWGDEPRRMIDYSQLLYPQYDDSFTTISLSTKDWLIATAKSRLSEITYAHPDVVQRWKEIADGRFPKFVKVGES